MRVCVCVCVPSMMPASMDMLSKWMHLELILILPLNKRCHWASLFMETSVSLSMITKIIDNWEYIFIAPEILELTFRDGRKLDCICVH